MVVNDDAGCLTPRGDLRFFASKLAPTGGGVTDDQRLRRSPRIALSLADVLFAIGEV
jgi:hypothetical protein